MDETKRQMETSIGCCLLTDNGKTVGSLDRFRLDDFESELLRAIVGCAREEGKADPILVKRWADKNHMSVMVSELTQVLLSCASTKNFSEYIKALCDILHQEGLSRISQRACTMTTNGESPESIISMINKEREELDSRFLNKSNSGELLPVVEDLMLSIEEGRNSEGQLVATGFTELDELHGGGFMPNELIVLAARPSCGKTALAMQIAIDCNMRVCLFSLEMNKRQLAVRLLANVSGRNTKVASRNPSQLSSFDRDIMLSATEIMRRLAERIAVYDEPDQTVATIRSTAKKEVESGAKIIIIDYLQLITSTDKSESREREVANISRSLKNLSKELDVPVIVLAQVNRSCEAENRVPRLSDLRESGAIEQDANSVIFLHDTGTKTDTHYKVITMIVAKGRDVGTGYRKLYFNSDRQRFYSLECQ